MSRRAQPLNGLQWLPREQLKPNNYNPNKMAPPERALLKTSLLEDGWTQPIVLFADSDDIDILTIVDGFHRWELSEDPEILAMTDGKVPCVFIEGDEHHRMMSTIRHNRARGQHGVLPMATIVQKLLSEGVPQDTIQKLLSMEAEEVERLSDRAGLPEQTARTKKEFAEGWVPG